MAVGFDSDDTIFHHNEPFQEWLLEEKGIVIDGFHHYHLWKAWDGTQEEAIRYIQEFYRSDRGDLRRTIPGIEKLIAHYKEQGEALYVISARSFSQERVITAYEDLFPGTFDDIIFGGHFLTGSKETKADIAKKLGIHTFFEDAYHHAEDLARTGIKTYLHDRDWNKRAGEDSEGIHRKKDWYAALDEIKRLALR